MDDIINANDGEHSFIMVVCLKIRQTACHIKKPFYQKKFVFPVCDHLNGARNGKEAGKM